jgi:hypothetical protein
MTVCGQSAANLEPRDESSYSTQQMIEDILRTHLYDGHYTKRFRVSGDAVAVAMTKAITDRDLTTIDIQELTDMLLDAFSEPGSIADKANRRPSTTLFLLRDFSRRPESVTIRASLADARARIASSLKDSEK